MCSGRYSFCQVSVKETYANAIADFLLEEGLATASLRPIAKAAGTSDRMLIYHFGDKAGVLQAGLDVVVDRNMAILEAALPPDPLPATQIMMLMEQALQSPAFQSAYAVFFELAAMSLRGDENARVIGQRIAEHLHGWLAARLTEPDRAGELLAAIDGWAVLSAVGLDLPFPTG